MPGTSALQTQTIAPGAHIEVRDAVWRVVRIDPTSNGTAAWRCVGVSEIVRDQDAVFLEELEPKVRVLDPRETKLVRDTSKQHRAGLLYMESLLREVPPPDDALYVGHRAAMDLLDFQLEPAWRSLGKPRQRILIADAVGLGKTLEAGILLSELIRRGRARRILVATTKAMLTQFQKKLWGRFTIPLVRLDSIGLQRIRAEIPTHHNPFYYYDRTIISIDTLKQNNWFRTHVEKAYWDVIVVDEAHNVASRGSDPSQRARIADLLAQRCDSWSVVKVHVPGRSELVTAVGSLLGVQPGESLRLSGRWVQDKKYGEQIRVESYLTVQPATLVGMEKYLGSGLVRGVGKVMAARLVKHFEFSTLDVIDQDPDRLTEVEGIGPKRKARVIAAWAEQKAVKEVMLFLQSHGVSTTFAVKIYKQYKDRAIAVVRENPYQLAVDIFGIGFKTADKIAADLGISPTSPRRAEAGVLHVLGELSDEGHVFCPHDLLVERAAAVLEIETPIIETAIGSLSTLGHVVVEPLAPGQPVYLKSLHISEQGAAEKLCTVLSVATSPITIDVDRGIQWLEEQQQIALAAQQQEAIRRAVSAKVLVITGGPGTGKTTIVNGIIRVLEKKGRRILLCAPTGRAAKRMAETTGREAKTIHRLLEFNPRGMCFDRNADRPLEADLLVVDEMSMVDIVLFYNLLKAVPPACQLVLVGDVDQLPSVGPGSVLRDLIQSGATEVVTLTEIFRQAQQSLIVVNAHRINQGQQPLGLKTAQDAVEAEPGQPGASSEPDFFFIEREEPETVLAMLKELVARRIPSHFRVDALEDIQVLTPMHRGLLGSLSLNAELQGLLNPEGESLVRGSRVYRVGDKVMQIRNNYELEVFNGDIGRVVKIDAADRQVQVRFDDRVVTYDTADLDELVLGYACSIHKSQGSEYPVVVLPLHTQHYIMLQRNLLYTGITRGRKLVVIVGTRRAMAIAVKNNRVEARYTRLTEHLQESAR